MFSGAREYRNQGELMQVRLTIIGTMSLLMHNAQLSDPLATITKQLKKVSGKRIKTEADHEEMARIEFEGGLYFDDESGPYIPSANIHACLLKAARMTRQGPAVERGIIVLNEVHPLAYNGPRTIQGLYDDKNFVSRLSVGVTTSRVMRTRPMFRQWALESELIVDDGQLDLDQITSIADKAGQMIGLGDYRPRFGRFNVEVTEIKD